MITHTYRVLPALVMLSGLLPAQERQEYWTREFTVPVELGRNTQAVDLQTVVGDLEVGPGNGQLQVIVKARRDRVEEGEVSDRADDHFSVRQEDGTLVIRSLHEQDDEREGGNPWQVSFALQVPRPMAVAARTAVGDIEVSEAEGAVRLHTSVGDVTVDSDAAASVSATTGVGDVTLRCARVSGGVVVESATGSLDVLLGSVGDGTEIKTGVGDINLDCGRGLSAQLQLSTGVGRIQTNGVELTGTRRMVGQNGSVEIGQGGRSIPVATGVGNITVRRGPSDR